MGDHDDPGGHDDESDHFASDARRGAADPLIEPQVGEGHRDERVADRDDRDHRRNQRALLKCVEVQQEAQRTHDGQGIDWPVRQDAGYPGTSRGDYELDQERSGSVADAAGQRQGEGPDIVTAPGQQEASANGGGEPCPERQHNEEADAGVPIGRPRDGKESGQPRGGGEHAPDQLRVDAME